jgi:hypothetical protein
MVWECLGRLSALDDWEPEFILGLKEQDHAGR